MSDLPASSSAVLSAPPLIVDPAQPGLARQQRERLFQGMQRISLEGNARIGVLMELVGALSRLNEARDVLRVFSEGMRKLYGLRGYISLSTRGLKPGEYRITRMLTEADGAMRIHTSDPWSTINALPIHTGGFFGELIRSAYPELIHHLNVKDDPVL